MVDFDSTGRTYTDQLGHTRFEVLDSTLKVTKALSNSSYSDTVKYDYGTFDRQSQITDPRGLKTKFWYDGFGNLTGDSSIDEGKSRYYYDSHNRLRFIKNALGEWSYKKYDGIGRPVESGFVSNPDTTYVDTMNYPSSGTTVKTKYIYDIYVDSIGHSPLSQDWNNPKGNLTEILIDADSTWLYYDDRGREVHKQQKINGLSGAKNIYYTYGFGNQIKKITYPDSSQISYEYYDSGRVKKIPGYIDNPVSTGAPGLEWEPWGAPAMLMMHDTSMITNYSYECGCGGIPTKIFTRKGAEKIWGESYHYNPTRMIDTVRALNDSGGSTDTLINTYGYDYLYRLHSIHPLNRNSSKTIRYWYDQSGNRQASVMDSSGSGQVDSIYYMLDQNTNQIDNLTGQVTNNYTWDARGCLEKDSSKHMQYFFDRNERLDSIKVNGIKRLEFKYDAAGKRIKKIMYTGISCDSSETCETNKDTMCVHSGTCDMFVPGDVNNNGSFSGADVIYLVNYLKQQTPPLAYPVFRADANCDGFINGGDVSYLLAYSKLQGPPPKCCYWICTDTLITYYVYSGNQVIAEYDQSGALEYNYLYLGNKRLARWQGSTKNYYINDVRGSVVLITDQTGSVLYPAALDYYPFGSVLSTSGDSRYKYTGKELDEGYDFDLYYYGARYYNAALGRFISPDWVSWFYYNTYSYCCNDPINLTDEDGKQPGPNYPNLLNNPDAEIRGVMDSGPKAWLDDWQMTTDTGKMLSDKLSGATAKFLSATGNDIGAAGTAVGNILINMVNAYIQSFNNRVQRNIPYIGASRVINMHPMPYMFPGSPTEIGEYGRRRADSYDSGPGELPDVETEQGPVYNQHEDGTWYDQNGNFVLGNPWDWDLP